MATHSSVLAWRIPGTGGPGGLPSLGSHRVGHDWATSLSLFTFHALEKEMATHFSVLAWRIPGTVEPGGLPSMGLHRVRHNSSNLSIAQNSVKAYKKLVIKTAITMDLSGASVVSNSMRPHRLQPTRLPLPWDSPGKNTGVGCHFLLHHTCEVSLILVSIILYI